MILDNPKCFSNVHSLKCSRSRWCVSPCYSSCLVLCSYREEMSYVTQGLLWPKHVRNLKCSLAFTIISTDEQKSWQPYIENPVHKIFQLLLVYCIARIMSIRSPLFVKFAEWCSRISQHKLVILTWCWTDAFTSHLLCSQAKCIQILV